MKPDAFTVKSKVYVRAKGDVAQLLCDAAAFELRRDRQRETLRSRWLKEGLPGSVSFVHVFSGEMDLILDHETMRWARSLKRGDKVTLAADPRRRRRRQERPAVARTDPGAAGGEVAHLTDLKAGQRLHLRCLPHQKRLNRASSRRTWTGRASGPSGIEWFLATVYCTCGVRGDTCTGHFYTLASCNPNGCGQPNAMRKCIGQLIDQKLTDRQIIEKLLKDEGPGLLQPHLLP